MCVFCFPIVLEVLGSETLFFLPHEMCFLMPAASDLSFNDDGADDGQLRSDLQRFLEGVGLECGEPVLVT